MLLPYVLCTGRGLTSKLPVASNSFMKQTLKNKPQLYGLPKTKEPLISLNCVKNSQGPWLNAEQFHTGKCCLSRLYLTCSARDNEFYATRPIRPLTQI